MFKVSFFLFWLINQSVSLAAKKQSLFSFLFLEFHHPNSFQARFDFDVEGDGEE